MIFNINLLVVLLIMWTGLGTSFLYRREIRFTKVNANFYNKSVGEVIDFSIRHLHGHHHVNLHTFVKIPLSLNSINLELLKCKDHYIDCLKSHSYLIKNFCDSMKFYMSIFIKDQSTPENFKCPIKGTVEIQNMTLNAEQLMGMLGTLEPWWESYWTLKTSILNNDKSDFFFIELNYYFISTLVYKRNTKTN